MKDEIHPREARLAEKQKLDGELTKARTQLVQLCTERDAITVALRKGELIKKYDAKVALGFLLTGMRQRLMSLSYALPPRLVGRTEHEIGRLLDEEMRLALRDIASWPEKMANPGWCKNIDEDLRPAPEVASNSNGEAEGAVHADAQRERTNAKRRAVYAKSKEG